MTLALLAACVVVTVALVAVGRALGLDGPWEPKP
jgi:hypothetical protein